MLEIANINHVPYFPCKIRVDDSSELIQGCYSYNFAKQEREITLAKVLKQLLGDKVFNNLFKNKSTEQKIEDVYKAISTYISKDVFDDYLSKILNFDALVLNEDRHLNNISFFYSNGRLHPTPIYDNGAALLSDTREYYGYPLDIPVSKLIRKVKAKPFSMSFEKQASYLPYKLIIPREAALAIVNKYRGIYKEDVISRVRKIVNSNFSGNNAYINSYVGFSAWTRDNIVFKAYPEEGSVYKSIYPPFKNYVMIKFDSMEVFTKFMNVYKSINCRYDAVSSPKGDIHIISQRLIDYMKGR